MDEYDCRAFARQPVCRPMAMQVEVAEFERHCDRRTRAGARTTQQRRPESAQVALASVCPPTGARTGVKGVLETEVPVGL